MNVNLETKDETSRYTFNVEIDGQNYTAVIYTNAKGKFIDYQISFVGGGELESEGTQGQIRENIIDFLDQNWDKLV